jgi:hypothetical protein
MVQRDMGIASGEPYDQGRHQSAERSEWISSERTEQQVKPDNVRLKPSDGFRQTKNCGRIVERPTPQNRKAFGFRMLLFELIGQNREAKKWIPLEFLSDV